MAKDPAFLFYTNDFSSGTQFFSDEQLGKYLRLLMAQHQHGHLSEIQVLHICKTYDNHIMQKFIQDEKGLFYNQRLQTEIDKRVAYSESRKKNKLGTGKVDTYDATYVPHMENKDEIIDIDKKEIVLTKEQKSKIFYSEQVELSKGKPQGENYERFVTYLLKMNPTHVYKLRDQLSYDEFEKLKELEKMTGKLLKDKIDSLINNTEYTKGRVSAFLILQTWMKK